jgi:hypothetical protein
MDAECLKPYTPVNISYGIFSLTAKEVRAYEVKKALSNSVWLK